MLCWGVCKRKRGPDPQKEGRKEETNEQTSLLRCLTPRRLWRSDRRSPQSDAASPARSAPPAADLDVRRFRRFLPQFLIDRVQIFVMASAKDALRASLLSSAPSGGPREPLQPDGVLTPTPDTPGEWRSSSSGNSGLDCVPTTSSYLEDEDGEGEEGRTRSLPRSLCVSQELVAACCLLHLSPALSLLPLPLPTPLATRPLDTYPHLHPLATVQAASPTSCLANSPGKSTGSPRSESASCVARSSRSGTTSGELIRRGWCWWLEKRSTAGVVVGGARSWWADADAARRRGDGSARSGDRSTTPPLPPRHRVR